MANTDIITLSWKDYKGVRGTVKAFIPTGSTIANITLFASSLAVIVDQLTGALFIEATVTRELVVIGIGKVVATDDRDWERGANISYNAADTPYRHTQRIGGTDPTEDDGFNLQLPILEWTQFFTLMEDGGDLIIPCDRFGNDLVAQFADKITFHKS